MTDLGGASSLAAWLLEPVVGTTGYLALFTADPLSVQDPLTVELVSAVYSREAFVWTAVSTELLSNDQDGLFYGLPAGTNIAGVGVYDAAVNGNLQFAMAFDAPLSFPDGGTLRVPSGVLWLRPKP